MASLFDWAGLATGVASAYVGYEASKDASDATNKSTQLAADRVADFEATYGPIEDNLSTYYKNLTPEKYTQQNLQTAQAEYQKASGLTAADLAQRGIDAGSGIAAEAELNLQKGLTENRATIQSNADSAVAAEKMNFLGLGLGMESGIYGANQTALANQAKQANATATGSGQAVGDLITAAQYKEGYTQKPIEFW
jgi:hypothetical protein